MLLTLISTILGRPIRWDLCQTPCRRFLFLSSLALLSGPSLTLTTMINFLATLITRSFSNVCLLSFHSLFFFLSFSLKRLFSSVWICFISDIYTCTRTWFFSCLSTKTCGFQIFAFMFGTFSLVWFMCFKLCPFLFFSFFGLG